MIWAVATLLAGGLMAWAWVVARHMVRATQGAPVPQRAGVALLLIELQDCLWTDAQHDGATRAHVEAAVAREVEMARLRNQPVIAVRQEWRGLMPRLIARLTRPGAPMRGGADVELAPAFRGMADHVIVKTVEDGFETGELDALLDVLRVGRLRLVGREGCAGLARTAQAALNRGYEVELVRDGIATADSAAFDAVLEALTSQGARVV
jgi:nicotinamidase-related amidase